MMRMSEKQIQIPQRLLIDVYKLVIALEDYKLTSGIENLAKEIETQIGAKIERMDRRKTFTEYKTAPVGEEREQKRQEYLEKAGVSKDWQTTKETHI